MQRNSVPRFPSLPEKTDVNPHVIHIRVGIDVVLELFLDDSFAHSLLLGLEKLQVAVVAARLDDLTLTGIVPRQEVLGWSEHRRTAAAITDIVVNVLLVNALQVRRTCRLDVVVKVRCGCLWEACEGHAEERVFGPARHGRGAA